MERDTNGSQSFDARPDGHIFPMPAERLLLNRVKGEFRRELIASAMAIDELDELPIWLMRPSLEAGERERLLAAFGASDLAGENLPDPELAEVEVARIVFGEVEPAVTCVYVKKSGCVFRYRIVTENVGCELKGATTCETAEARSVSELTAWLFGVWPLPEILTKAGYRPREACRAVSPSSHFYPNFAPLVLSWVMQATTTEFERQLDRVGGFYPLPETFPEGTQFLIRDDAVPMTYGPSGPGCPGGHLTWGGRVPEPYGSYSGLLEADSVSEAQFRSLVARIRRERKNQEFA